MAIGSFTQFMDAAIAEVKGKVDDAVRQATYNLFVKIVDRTPEDTGQARGNWNCSIGEPDISVEPHASPDRGYDEATKALGFEIGSVVYFTNSLPYIRVLEFGLYPNPPIKGTYIPAGRVKHGIPGPGYHKFSAGGFSKLAPKGMVRLSIAEFNLRIPQQ